MAQVLAKQNTDQRVIFSGTWEQFRLIQEATQKTPGIRLSFFEGEIEILMPGFEHENFAEIIGYLVTTFLLAQGIRFHPSGSMTQEKEGEASTQADKSFCLDEPKPIPDLSIEVVYTSGGLGKLPKYQALGVPEVWFWEDGSLRLYHLRDAGYVNISKSEIQGLENLDLDFLQRCVLACETDFAAGVQSFQEGIHQS
jgi:Uma2 family endonuclease